MIQGIGTLAICLSACTGLAAWRPELEPILLAWRLPLYPEISRLTCMEGTQRIRISVASDGRPLDAVCVSFDGRARATHPGIARVTRSGGVPLLCDWALREVHQWHYEPSQRATREHVVDFLYQLMPEDATPSDVRSRFITPSVFAVRSYRPPSCKAE